MLLILLIPKQIRPHRFFAPQELPLGWNILDTTTVVREKKAAATAVSAHVSWAYNKCRSTKSTFLAASRSGSSIGRDGNLGFEALGWAWKHQNGNFLLIFISADFSKEKKTWRNSGGGRRIKFLRESTVGKGCSLLFLQIHKQHQKRQKESDLLKHVVISIYWLHLPQHCCCSLVVFGFILSQIHWWR